MVETVLNRIEYEQHYPEDFLEPEDDGVHYPVPSHQLSVGLPDCKIIRDDFGFYRLCETEPGKVIHRFTLLNKDITVQVLTYGAIITAITMPDKNGIIDDVVLGFDSSDEYRSPNNPYLGATIGRITGVIPRCEISIENEKHFLTNNYLGIHHANGGIMGFDRVMWNAFVADDKLYLTYMSQDSEEGFPGDVLVTRSYELTTSNELIIETTAKCSKPTPIDISTHVDWNLSGHGGGPEELYKHYLMINADKYAQMDKDYIITGKLKKVSRTVLDFRIPRPLGKLIHKVPGGGFNHFLNLTRGSKKSITFAAKLFHPGSGRSVEIISDQPGLLIYTQNNMYAPKNVVEGHPISCWVYDPTSLLDQQKGEEQEAEGEHRQEENEMEEHEGEEFEMEGTDVCPSKQDFVPLHGKQNVEYIRHCGIRLVPANFPEPVARRRNYDTYITHPGETYLNTTIYKFGTRYEKPINLAEVVIPDPTVPPDELTDGLLRTSIMDDQ